MPQCAGSLYPDPAPNRWHSCVQVSEALSSPQLAEAVQVLQRYYSTQQLQVGGTEMGS